MSRRVVILCGPPGAGKSTAAQSSGLKVYDRDDSQWSSERDFQSAMMALARDPVAQAVVIRSAPTSTARAKWARMAAATECMMVIERPEVCIERVRSRGRDDMASGIASVPKWFAKFDELDGVRRFTGWDHAPGLALGTASRSW